MTLASWRDEKISLALLDMTRWNPSSAISWPVLPMAPGRKHFDCRKAEQPNIHRNASLEDRVWYQGCFCHRCRSKREANSIVSYTRQEANSLRIDRMTAELLLEAALADGMDNGYMPAPGFIDVMEACDLNGLRPQQRDLQALLDYADPQREVQNATPVKLDLMLNDDKALDGAFATDPQLV